MLSQSAQSRALAERQAVNTLIQGSAADIIKSAMLAVHGDEELRNLSARLILQVHDELVLEAPEAHAEARGPSGRRTYDLVLGRRHGSVRSSGRGLGLRSQLGSCPLICFLSFSPEPCRMRHLP